MAKDLSVIGKLALNRCVSLKEDYNEALVKEL